MDAYANLHDLLKAVEHKWFEIGVLLGLSISILERIKRTTAKGKKHLPKVIEVSYWGDFFENLASLLYRYYGTTSITQTGWVILKLHDMPT